MISLFERQMYVPSFEPEAMMSKISVILPVYNRASMLAEALDSVRNQSLPPDEIIVVDDGSIDGSGARAREFPGVRVIPQTRQGVAAARNRGIRSSSCNLIAFLDSDDIWHPTKLEKQKAFMDLNRSYPLSHTGEIWIRKGCRVNQSARYAKSGGEVFARSVEVCFIAASTVMARRELFDEIGEFDESFPACEDYDFWLRTTCCHEVGYLPESLTTRREGHGDQLSHTIQFLDRFRIIALVKRLREKGLDPEKEAVVRQTLTEKISIVAKGLRKRGLSEELEEMQALADEFQISEPFID